MGLISLVSGRDTDTIVATGNSSKIHVGSSRGRNEYDTGEVASDCGIPVAMSFSDDIPKLSH